MQVAVFAAENNHLHLLKINVYYSLLAMALQPVGFAGKINHNRATIESQVVRISHHIAERRNEEAFTASLSKMRKSCNDRVRFRSAVSNHLLKLALY